MAPKSRKWSMQNSRLKGEENAHRNLFYFVISHSGKDPSTLFVICGDWYIQRDVEPEPVQERGVSEVWIHPEYPRDRERGKKDKTRAQFQDNVALLFVKEDFEMGKSVDKICLPSSVKRSYEKEHW